MGLLDKVNNLVETIKNAVSGGSSSNESSAHSSGGGTSSDAARSAAQAAAAKYQADGQKRTASTKSSTNNVLVDSIKHTPTSSGRTYSGIGTKAQNPEKAEKKAAAQTAADIAQQRGQSRTNYLKTYKTEESNYQAPKYKSSEDLNGTRANAYDPADRYIAQAEGARNSTVDYMTGAERKAAEKASKRPKNYLSEADFRQMDINDAYSPNWTDDKRLKETNGFQSVDDIADWGKNVVKAVGTSVGGSFLSNTGAAYEAGNGTDSWRTQEAVAQMNDAYQQALRVAVEQMNSADPDSYSDQLDAAKRELLAYAATIGNGMAEQVESNLTSAINQMKADPHNDHLFEYLLNNGNSGTLPDTTTFQGAALATRDMAREMFGQSQGYTEAAKAAAGNTTVGNILTDVAINLAEQGIDAAVGFLGSMGAAPQIASKVYQSISLGNMALRVFGQTASQVRDEGGNFGQQTFEAGLAAGVEVLTEKMSGGIAKFYGKGDTDEIVEEIARRVTQSDFGRSVIRTIGGMTGEAFEEVISTVVDPVVRAVHDSEATDKYATAEGRQELATEAGYSALVAALAALAGSSATYINGSNAQANAALTQTDQIQAELESNGMSTKDARKVAPNVQKYQSEGFEGLSKSEQKTLTNPLIRSIYGIDIELDSATDTINKQTDGKRVKPAQVAAAEKTMSDRLTPEIFAEYKKFNDESQTRETVMAAADAFNNELFDAVEGDVILDQNNRPVGTVKTVNDYGITIQYNDGTTESAVFMGNNGLLDPNSNLAKVFNDGGGVVAQDDADIIIRNAEQERKAQIKEGEEMQDRGEKAQPRDDDRPVVPFKTESDLVEYARNSENKSLMQLGIELLQLGDDTYNIGYSWFNPPIRPDGTADAYYVKKNGKIVAAGGSLEEVLGNVFPNSSKVPPKRPAPTPAKAQPTQQQTTQQQAPQQEQQAPTGPQFQNQDVFDNTKYKIDQDSNGKFVVYDANNNAVGGTYDTYAEAVELAAQMSQQNPTPQTQETQEAETPVQAQEESQSEATQEQEAPSELEAPPSRSPLTESVTEANTVTENNGTPSKAEQYFADNPKKTTYQTTYKEAGVKIKKNADGTFTVSMASPKKNGHGWTKAVSVIGTVNSISEANQLVVDEYSKKSAPKALTDSATGTPLKSPQNASQSVSQEEGNSVLPNEQNASEAQNEELNSKPEAEPQPEPTKAEEKPANPLVDEKKEAKAETFEEWRAKNYPAPDSEEANKLFDDYLYNRSPEEQEEEIRIRSSDLYKAFDEVIGENVDNADFSLDGLLKTVADKLGEDIAHYDPDTGELTSIKFQPYLAGKNVEELIEFALDDYTQYTLLSPKTEDANALRFHEDALKKAKLLYAFHSEIAYAEESYNGIVNGDKASTATEADIKAAFAYIDTHAEQIAKASDNPAFKRFRKNEHIDHNNYVESAIKADLLRRVNLAKQSQQKENQKKNPLTDHAPVAEDDHGNKLTKNVADFFRNSKLRDALGRLRTFFHGTKNLEHKSYDFNYADDGLTMWLSDSHDITKTYVGTERQASYFDEEEGVVGDDYEAYYIKLDETKANELLDNFNSVIQSIKDRLATENVNLDRYLNDYISIFKEAVDEAKSDSVPTSKLTQITDALENEGLFGEFEPTDAEMGRIVLLSDQIYDLSTIVMRGDVGKQASVPVYVNMENPLVVEGKGDNWNAISLPKEVYNTLKTIGRDADPTDFRPNKLILTQEERNEILRVYTDVFEKYWPSVAKYLADLPMFRDRAEDVQDSYYHVVSPEELEDFLSEDEIWRFPATEKFKSLLEEINEKEAYDIIDGLDKQIEKGQIPGETTFSARTRDIALAAYALGYDGVLIKDITDYGPNMEEMEVDILPHDILAVFNSNQVKDVKNENPTKSEDYRYKERLSDDEELARLDGGIAASEFNPDRPITAEKAHRLSKTDRIERAQKWAKHFEIKDGTVGLYDRLIRYIVDHDSAVTDAQREEIFALLAESASIKMNEQEQRMSKANDSVELDTDEDANADATSKYSDPSRGFDFTPDESDAEDAYDWKKVSGYMAENNRDTALARKAVLEELFPEKEFRVSDDGGSIEEVYGHTTTKNPLSKEERSWWRKHGWEEINKKFKKNFFQVKNLIPAWLRNGTYNKNLTDMTEDGRMGNRLSVHSMQYNGLRYYYQVGEGMYRHILNSNIMTGVNEVISRHEKLAARLKERIENGYQLAETPNALTGISSEQALQGVQQLEKKLKAEEGWLEKVRSGKYTLGNFYSDRSGVVTQADIQTVLDSVRGEDKTFETFSLKSLSNAMSESAAKELIDSIYKEATDGLYSRGINGDSSAVQPGEQAAGIQLGQLDNGDSQWRSEETGRAPSSVTDRTTYDESSGRINGRDVLPRRNSRRSNAVESGTDGSVSGEQGADGQTVGVGNDSTNRRRDFRARSERSAEELNNKLKIRGFRLGKSGGNGKRITARLDGKSTFLNGDVTPRVQGGGAVADIINKAFESLNIVVNGITGNIYNFHGEFDAPGGMFTPKSSGWYTNPVSGYYNATKGRVLLRNIDGSNHNDVVKTARHEAQHRINERIPNIDAFARKLLKNVGADYDLATTRIKYTYGFVMGMDNDRIADEVLSRIADGDGFGTGMITAEQAAQLYEALTTSAEWQSAIGPADDVRALFRGTSSQIFTDDTSLTNLGRNKAPTVIGQNAQQHTEAPQEQPITDISFNGLGTEAQQADAARKEADRQTAKQRGIDLGLTREENIQSLADSIRDALRDRNYGLAQQMLSYASEQDMRLRQDLDQYSDESFDALVNDTSYEEASAINGQNYDDYDLNSELGAEQASETGTLNNMSGRGVDTTAAPIENFQNAEQASENAAIEDLSGTEVDTERTPIDYFQSQEQASESDLIREQSRNDLTGSEDTNFESPYEAEQRTEQEAMDSLYENMDGRKLTSPKRTANDYYGSAYARVQETQKKHKRNKARSSFSIAELYYKTYGETNDSIRNFKRLQKLNSNVDSLLDGKMSYYDFNSFAKNMSSRQGIGQILNDDIQRELDTVVALEEVAQDKNASEQDVADFQYAAANVVSHIVARMDMVEKTERARARLDTAAKKHGAKGGRKNLVGTALDAWNRYQITGDNFWRMMDDWAGKGQGYSYAREHLKTIATRISEEAKLKGYFALEGVDRKSKEFKDFVDGTSMSNVDFNGHKISLMEGIKFVKTVDTLKMFASENGRPSWQRVAALGGFTFEGKNGKPIFVDIQGSYDNNAAARAAWVEQRYNQLKQEIANNKAASAYMSAVEEMYYEASKDAEKVHSKVNGYDRYMYGKGWYTDIHYAKKGDGTVDFRYSDRDATDVHDTASMQRRTKVAGGYAIINPMSRSVDAYISQISNYIAFEEFGQKLGVLSDGKSINGSYANTVRDAYGDQYAQWFDNYVKTMTLYKEHNPKGGMNSALAKARQAMMSGALIGSVSVPIKQVSSFFDTMGTLDPRAVAVAFGTNPLGLKQKGIKNYLMDSRNQSISDPDLAELFGDKGILRKIKDTRIGKLAMSATNMMDATAVSNVYRACVLDVEYNNPLGKGIYNNGKNFKDGLTPDGQFYVDAKFEEALLGSQPIFTPQARNELARTDNQFARMFSTFRTQQTQNYNRMLQTWNEYQAARKNGGDTKETGKKFVQTMTGQMIASASLSALTAIANTVLHKHRRYKDDDDELDEEKFWQRFGLGAFESLMGNSLFVGDITKWAIDLYNSQNDPNWNWKYSTKESQYFDAIEGMHIPIPASGAIGTAIQALNSAINLYRDVDENGWSDQNRLSARYLAGNIATAFGVQLNNVYYALNAGYQWYMDAAQLVTGNKKYEQKYDDIFTQMVKVDYSQQNRLVNSILAGKTQKVDDMFDDMGQDKFENAVYYGAFDQYKAGKIDKAEYVELLMNFAGKSYKEAHNEVEKKSRLLESGISQYNGIDGRDGRKAFYDQYSGNFQSRDAYKQFFEDVKNGKAEGKHNTYYTQWYGQPQEVSANQSSIIDTMNRNIQAGNFDYATAKLLWEYYYGYSTSKYSAWKFVGK